MLRERVDVLGLLRKQAETADIDFLREALLVLVEALIDAEVQAKTGAEYGERTPERLTRRNGYLDYSTSRATSSDGRMC